MLPYTSKFYANGTIFDSVGNIQESYISKFSDGDVIYYLRDTSGTVQSYDTHTEEVSTFSARAANDVTDLKSVVVNNGDIYGFMGYDATYFDVDSAIYIIDDNKLVQERYDYTSRVTLLSSSSNIRDFVVMQDGSYIVLHGSSRITKFSHARMTQYSFALQASAAALSGIMALSANPELLAVDCVREYTSGGLVSYPIVLGRINTGQMFLARIDESVVNIKSAAMINGTGTYYPRGDARRINYNLTNYTYLLNKYGNKPNTILFKLTLKNAYNNRDVHDIEMPVDVAAWSSGYHHFVFRLDTTHGVVSLFVDGREHSTAALPSLDYTFQDITYESMCLGATYFANNIPLFQKLKQPNYYMIDNCKLKQFRVYKQALTDNEVRFLTYNNTPIHDMVASLPCGQRNELDQIERVFSFNVPGNKSNSVNIIIKNSNITDAGVQERVRSMVQERLQKVLPVTTHINQVVFRNTT